KPSCGSSTPGRGSTTSSSPSNGYASPFPAEDAHLRRRTPCPRAPRRDPAVADNDPRSGSPTDSRSDPPREPASPADTPRQPPTGVLTARSGLAEHGGGCCGPCDTTSAPGRRWKQACRWSAAVIAREVAAQLWPPHGGGGELVGHLSAQQAPAVHHSVSPISYHASQEVRGSRSRCAATSGDIA